MDSKDSQQTSKLKSNALSEHLHTLKGQEDCRRVIKRKAMDPSKPFLGNKRNRS